jgi:UDP-N-acetylmuramate dehydrogenase
LVSDRGIRGIVVDMQGLGGCTIDATLVTAGCGAPISDTAECARDNGLSGLEFAYSLPGSVGGAVWMNARCYDRQMSDVLEHVEFLDTQGNIRRESVDLTQWSYKVSPFQSAKRVILSAAIRLSPGDPAIITAKMQEHKADRVRKGHFLHPCAGSVFKNNRDFGAPTGKIIDSLGLRGTRIGGAQIAPFHGNIIINTHQASASDVVSLIVMMEAEVQKKLGLRLEREVLLVGDW